MVAKRLNMTDFQYENKKNHRIITVHKIQMFFLDLITRWSRVWNQSLNFWRGFHKAKMSSIWSEYWIKMWGVEWLNLIHHQKMPALLFVRLYCEPGAIWCERETTAAVWFSFTGVSQSRFTTTYLPRENKILAQELTTCETTSRKLALKNVSWFQFQEPNKLIL